MALLWRRTPRRCLQRSRQTVARRIIKLKRNIHISRGNDSHLGFSLDTLKETKRDAISEIVNNEVESKSEFYNQLLQDYVNDGEIQKAGELYCKMKEDSIACEENVYTKIIESCAKSGELLQAEIWLNRMQEAGLTPDQNLFTLAIKACVESGSHEDAHHWLEIMNELGMKPDPATSEALVNVNSQSGNNSLVRNWIAAMERDGVPISTQAYYLAIDTCMRDGNIPRMQSFLESMREQGIRPTRNIYRSLIKSYSENKYLGAAQDTLETMIDENLDPDAHSYAQVINCCCAFGETKAAHIWLNKAIQHNSVNSECFISLISLYKEDKDSEKLLQLLDTMEKFEVTPRERSFYPIVFKALSATKANHEYVVKWLDRMQAQGLADVVALNEVLTILIENGNIDVAEEVLHQTRPSIGPNHISCSIILQALEKGVPERAVSFLLNMLLSLRVAPQELHYNSVLRSCARHGDSNTVKGLIESMISNGLNPNASTYESAIRAHAKRYELKQAEKWFDIAKKAGYGEGDVILNAMLEVELSLDSGNNVVPATRALNWAREMKKSSGAWPLNYQGTATLIKSLLEAGMESQARDCLEEILSRLKRGIETAILKASDLSASTGTLPGPIAEARYLLEAFIWFYSSKKNEAKISEWLDRAISSNVPVDSRWFSMAIQVHIVRGNVQAARSRFRQMHDLGLKRNEVIYNQIASIGLGECMGKLNEDTEEERLLHLLKADQFRPKVGFFRRMLGHAANKAREGDSLSRSDIIINLMEDEHVELDETCTRYALEIVSRKGGNNEKIKKKIVDSTNYLQAQVHDCLNRNNVTSALKLIMEMRQNGEEPSQKLYSRVLGKLLRENMLDDAKKFFYLIPQPSSYDFTLMASIHAREGSVSRVLNLRDYVFGASTEEMDLDCYQVLLQACFKSSPPDQKTAREVLHQLKIREPTGKYSTKGHIKGYLTKLLGEEGAKVFPGVKAPNLKKFE